MHRKNDKYCQTSIHRGQICLPLFTSHEMMTITGTLSIITRAQMHQFDSEVWFVYVILLRLTRSVVTKTILQFFFLFSPSHIATTTLSFKICLNLDLNIVLIPLCHLRRSIHTRIE